MGSGQPGDVGAPKELRQERAEETRRLLLDAAVSCLSEVGYARTTTTQVQRRAGVSRGALLYHFPSKAALLVASIRHLALMTARQMRARWEARLDTEDRIDAMLSMLWEIFSGRLFYVAIELWNAARTDPDLWGVLVREERALGRDIRATVSKGFGPEIAQKPGFERAVMRTVEWMRGMAMTEVLRRQPKLAEAEVRRWRVVFVAMLDEPTTPRLEPRALSDE